MLRRLLVSYRIVLCLTTLVVVLATYAAPVQQIEQWALRLAMSLVPVAPVSQRVTVATVDSEAIQRFGPWPWPRDRIASVVDQLHKLGARTIGLAFPLAEPQTPARLPEYQEQAVGLPKDARDRVRDWLRRLDTDRILAQSLQRAGTVVLGADRGVPGQRHEALSWPLKPAGAGGLPGALAPLMAAPSAKAPPDRLPLPEFNQAAAGIGHLETMSDSTPTGSRLAWREGERLIPSFALRVAMNGLAFREADLTLLPNGRLQLGRNPVTTATDWVAYPPPAEARNGQSAVEEVPIMSLWTRSDASRSVRNRVVLFGPVAPESVAPVTAPGGYQLAPVLWQAHTVAALLNRSALDVPAWFHGSQRGLLLGILLYLVLLPARWHGRIGLLIGGVGTLVLLNSGVLVLVTQGQWLPVTIPSLFLLGGQAALFSNQRHASRLTAMQRRTSDALRTLAENLMNQGRLDLAYERLCQCPPGRETLEPFYHLALEFERRRQFSKALASYDRISEIDPAYRDVENRRQRFRTVTHHASLTGTSGSNATTVVMVNDPTIERPVIGRYHIECELGRGAMGVVYRGVDPKIGRKVAIKCLAFTEEFEGHELEDIQRRFHREAEAAGRLDHPNVVTVYDVGEEHDLAYIAMDYVEGSSLEAYTHPDHLLPVEEALEVIAQVAEALDYAHSRNVVHRDIKPGNIIYNRDTGVLKVTDFGIARLTDESKTKSGSILGSPAYMSPEQVAGKKVDGRSDLFSLGSTLYQLLTGELPFTGDSVTNVLYRILNEKPKAVTRLRPELSTGLSRLVSRTLNKDPKKRYQSGAALAEALRRCI